jgi:hypothetical protein
MGRVSDVEGESEEEKPEKLDDSSSRDPVDESSRANRFDDSSRPHSRSPTRDRKGSLIRRRGSESHHRTPDSDQTNHITSQVSEKKRNLSRPITQIIPIGVVEQRISNLAQGSLCLVLCTGPFLHLLGLIPRGVLAGLL